MAPPYIWTDYLSKVSKEWETKAGRGASVNWPVGLAGKGNEGVSGSIQQIANSVGYVELAYAIQNKMTYGKVKNASGEFVQAEPAKRDGRGSRDEGHAGRLSCIDHECAGQRTSIPISSFTWLLIPSKIADPVKKKAIKDFLAWMLGTVRR